MSDIETLKPRQPSEQDLFARLNRIQVKLSGTKHLSGRDIGLLHKLIRGMVSQLPDGGEFYTRLFNPRTRTARINRHLKKSQS